MRRNPPVVRFHTKGWISGNNKQGYTVTRHDSMWGGHSIYLIEEGVLTGYPKTKEYVFRRLQDARRWLETPDLNCLEGTIVLASNKFEAYTKYKAMCG